MCGIVAYVGNKNAIPILLKGLERLEYRGYDSAGIAILNGDDNIHIFKKQGKVNDLRKHIPENVPASTIGIGHTRWATHGEPSDKNAHPHFSESKEMAIIHNGIIENYDHLKEALTKKGHNFKSDTDTEVLIHLIEEIQNQDNLSLGNAVQEALKQVIGAYAIVIIDKKNPDRLIAARKSSPLVIGVGDGEFFLASDATPIVEYTKEVVYLDDGEIAMVNKKGEFLIKTIDDEAKTPYIQELEIELDRLEKGGFEHFMLKEIYEQPKTIADSLRGRLDAGKGVIYLGGLNEYEHKFKNAKRIIIIACGTSWHSGLIGEYLFEDLARVPVEVDYASEFRYRNPVINEDDIVIAISQSGETADTLAALELAKQKGATIFGICNVVGSSIARVTDAGAYTHAGPEIGVASTKAFTSQLAILTLMALQTAHTKGSITESNFRHLLNALDSIPEKVEKILETNKDNIVKIAKEYKDAHNFLYLGRGYNFPVALEGALKLKEISYIHAEGYPAAEMKHGPIALIDENMPCVVVASNLDAYEKIVSNIQEVKARKGKIIAIVNKYTKDKIEKIADHIITVPSTQDELSPLLSVIPLQLLSYHIAVMRGCDVDQPRNLAKSVTVE